MILCPVNIILFPVCFSVFSEDDRQRWRDIVTHDSTFRTMIESAQTTEDVQSAVSQIR